MVGDIYLGKVEAVLPGIQAAFVNIGTEKSAFLHASDLVYDADGDEDDDEDAEDEEDDDDEAAERRRKPRPDADGRRRRSRSRRRIQDVAQDEGLRTSIIVQVSQGADLHQGTARHRAGLAGGTLPRLHALRDPRRREPQDRRARRAPAAARAGAEGAAAKDAGGVIVRTVGEDVTQETFERELNTLIAQWKRINKKTKFVGARRRSCTARPRSRAASSATCSRTKVDRAHGRLEAGLQRDRRVPEGDRAGAHRPRAPLRGARCRSSTSSDVETEIRDLFKRRCDLPSRWLPDHRADRGARLDRRELGALHRARRTPRRRSSRRTSRRRARSRASSGCATSAGSSSATSSTWRRRRTGTGCCRNCAPTWAATARAPRRSP